MKYLFLVFLLGVQMSYAQNNKTAGDIATEFPDCPPGLCPVAYVNLEIFNFHKPRTGCKSGFGLCIRFTTGITCEYCRWRTSLQNGQVESVVVFEGKKAIWHLPASLLQSLNEAEAATFELEEGMLSFTNDKGAVFKVKGGNYPVVKNEEDLTIELTLD